MKYFIKLVLEQFEGGIDIMKFSEYLLRNRKKFKYNQQEMTVQLSLLDDEFKDLSVVTYSRWECNVNVPVIRKILKILIFFKENIFDFYITTSFKPSLVEVKAFNRFLSYNHYFNDYWALFSYNSEDYPVFTKHGRDDPFPDTEKIQTSLRKFLHIENLPRKSSNEKIHLQKVGVMTLLTCKSRQGELLAHSGWVLVPFSRRAVVANSLLNGGEDIIPIQEKLMTSNAEITEPLIMMMRPILHFSRAWFDFVLEKIISTLLINPNIVEIMIPTVSIDNSKEMLNFGFSIVGTENSAKNLKQDKQKGLELRMLGMSSVDLLSNHGLNVWFKEYHHKKATPTTKKHK
ncbi:hypothetical protein [Vibrio crassostreae]|uniref:hypothetical protein n=1 Tax=Vibrio crassostreae TaxID=246167 RepID=UPI000630B5BC|nr:hypothetical protein [Vibrio crassostreae]TCO05907.1 hypothetical protein EDB30_102491 [Vibrio crassostreae]TCT63160.1 hypothetical protein EDB31_1327 [Vibrio crassostreae]CAK1753746.1 hypothetical protein VCRA2115O371_130083 [Vibrio crassostreae]CAK1758746.1 hypothetical protein VCRA2113O351_140037 [Vibrio crassostreae]CAK1762963.1 hypothetical protein VCRA2117O376_140037 [Vibrio crassostreae]